MPDRPASRATLTVALAGNPNSGKTTIFNALTGLRQKVANYPGVTVEKKTGRCKLADGSWIDIIDLPGTYSLISRSPDERVAMEVLRGLRPDVPAPDVVVVVVDASNLQRNLYLVSQLIELGRPLVVALNMKDVAERRGIDVSAERLAKELGAPVIPIVGHKHKGIAELKAAISQARVAPMPHWPLPEAMREELTLVGGGLAILDSKEAPPEQASVSDGPVAPRAWICSPDDARQIDRYQAIAERLLIGDRAPDIADLAQRQPVSSLLKDATNRLRALGIEPMQADVEAHYRWIEGVTHAATAFPRSTGFQSVSSDRKEEQGLQTHATKPLEYQAPQRHLTEKVDAILIHKFWGLVIFGLVMAALFFTIFFIADPLMGGMEAGVGWLGDFVTPYLPEGPIQDLWTDGIVAGVGAVIVFVPQIALLFLFLAVLEDSGYLARAAFLMDRLLAKVGLHGKSFIPMLSSFACAIPGIMATRTMEDRRDRLATIFVAPFMSCSARLPVYLLLIGTFFASYSAFAQGGIMLALYALGIVAAAGTAWIFKRTLLKGRPQAFILEMPTYKVPQLSQVARVVWASTRAFVVKAGTIIFCLSVILWAMTYYPRLPEWRATEVATGARTAYEISTGGRLFSYGGSETEDQLTDEAIASEQLRHSFAGRFGHLIEPVIRPLGYDWKMGVGLVGAFAAREVFVSTMAITYNAGNEDETEPLAEAMRSDTYADGSPVWTPLVAVSLLVWFVLAMQCMSTLAIVKRETDSWRWPLFMLVYMNGLAYVVCLGIYQVGRIWFA
ncbi:MAG TPA: ferrous iron transport protein B [Tepidisphaeraceae bacterium]|nr:ferrous iron transport protein B [Tepidisphaeraceae bacterium]